ncbi:MAG: DNA-binding protein WhiA, partial [Oscillospiraceae bacterium]|nr:DNA-binding protein WhiA [Oscillospiraceae bacterium]
MSFSAETKKEICESITGKKCCALAACYGILLYCNTFSAREIRIITGNPAFAQILPRLFKRAFGFGFDSISEKTGTRGKQSFIINDKEKLSAVFDAYGYDIDSLLVHHVNLGVLDEDCCKISFVKGAFLAGGSVTDPAKRYHFELVTAHHSVSRETYSLLLELGFLPRESSRKGNYIVYFKQSEVIEDVLTLLGASNAS